MKRCANEPVDGPAGEFRRELMPHIERIVRPVRASAKRGLRMRLDLLEHLESAIAEERSAGMADDELVARALKRLGNGEDLQRSLQESVPRWERLILLAVPAPSLVKQWERRSEREWGLLTMKQAAALCCFASLVTLLALACSTAVSFPIPMERRVQFFTMQAEHHARFLAICAAGGGISLASSLLVIALLAKAIGGRWRAVRLQSGLLVLLTLSWVLLVDSQVGGLPVGVMQILRGVFAGVALSAILVGSARLMVRRGNPLREWQSLELAK
jgi:hypothetical protein